MDLLFTIENQRLTLKDNNTVVNKANNYHNVLLDFKTTDWADKAIFVLLKDKDRNCYRIPYVDGGVRIPSGILTGERFYITVYGVTEDERVTTNELVINMHGSGYCEDILPIPEDYEDLIADIYLRLLTKLNISDIDDELDVNSADPVQNKIVTSALNRKSEVDHTHFVVDVVDFPELSNVATTGAYDDLIGKPTLSSLGGVVNIIKQSEPDDDYFATYVIQQGGSQVGVKINIPKDKLLKSAEVKTCTVDGVPPGFHVGDVYLDLVFNTADGGSEDRHQYVDLTKLIDVYSADNSTLQLVNGVFSIKNKGVGATQLSDDVNTKLGYAELFNSSACKGISSSDITNWNAKQDASNLVTSFGNTPSDSKYPSEKLVKDTIDSRIGDINDYVLR